MTIVLYHNIWGLSSTFAQYIEIIFRQDLMHEKIQIKLPVRQPYLQFGVTE